MSRTGWNNETARFKVKESGVGNILDNLFFVILAFYPLRHISVGLDLWDTGYNYANFQYMGTEHMDSMWLFSTYLANGVGNLISKLPMAESLVGMNFYTGLFVSILALAGYFFCTRKLEMPGIVVFLGEMLAISLCWCPTALLYNYLTYVLFLASCILLYCGLTGEKKYLLFAAGVLLGANVLVRFSNLPEAAMIVAVWAYDVILWLEERKKPKGVKVSKVSEYSKDAEASKDVEASKVSEPSEHGSAGGKEVTKSGFWPRLLRHTLWCLGGYLAALLVLFGYIQIRYGLDEYIAGIMRLFAMTDTATDYKATSMVMALIGTYVENLYWVIRIGVIIAGGVLAFAVRIGVKKCSRKVQIVWSAVGASGIGILYAYKFLKGVFNGIEFWVSVDGIILLLVLLIAVFGWIEKLPEICWILASVAMLGWLYYNHFTSLSFYSYDSMLRPGVLFLMLTMLIASIRIFHRNSPKEEKLISGMLILIVLLTSLGSNNKVYPSLNNLFIAAPYTLWQSWRFVCRVKEAKFACRLPKGRGAYELVFAAFPIKGILIAFLVMCAFQFGGFGGKFVFAEATGVQDTSAVVENNEILQGIKMSQEKAQWLSEITEYRNANDLEGQEVILYGDIPSLSYYLQMPSAFNPWSDLASYSLETMKTDMEHVAGMITEKGASRPVVIVENSYAIYQESGLPGLEKLGVSEIKQAEIAEDEKWVLLVEFMEAFGYEQVFQNGKFTIFR